MDTIFEAPENETGRIQPRLCYTDNHCTWMIIPDQFDSILSL